MKKIYIGIFIIGIFFSGLINCGDPIYLDIPPDGWLTPLPTPAPPVNTTLPVQEAVSFPVTYEAEDSRNELAAAEAVIREDPYCSGNALVCDIGAGNGTYLQFNHIIADNTAIYKCTIYYLNRRNDTQVNLRVNNGMPYAIYFSITNQQTVCKQIELQLNSGSNTLCFSTESYLPDLDCLVIDRREDQPVVYEAESLLNEVSAPGYAYVYDRFASGCTVVDYIGPGSDCYLQFNHIQVAETGRYRCTVDYWTLAAYSVQITVNDGSVHWVRFPDDSGNIVDKSFDILLNKGSNTLRLTADPHLPVIDCISITAPEPYPVLYEAESFINDIVIPSNNFPYDFAYDENASGEYMIGNVGAGPDYYLQFNYVMVESAGIYCCTFTYSTWTVFQAYLSINGAPGHLMAFANSGTNLTSRTLNIPLAAGANTLRFYSDEYVPNLDCLTITSRDTSFNRYEAEAILNNRHPLGTVIETEFSCSNNQLVACTNNSQENYLQFNYVYASNAGDYLCRFSYCAPRGYCLLSVNGGTGYPLEFPGAAWTNRDILLSLRQGDNTILLANPGNSYLPQLDYLEILPAPVPPALPVTYEAESPLNEIAAPRLYYGNSSSFSGNFCVEQIRAGPDEYLQFNHIYVPESAVYNCRLYYAYYAGDTVYWQINAATPLSVLMPGTAGSLGYLDLELELVVGLNSIRLTGVHNLPLLDCLIILEKTVI